MVAECPPDRCGFELEPEQLVEWGMMTRVELSDYLSRLEHYSYWERETSAVCCCRPVWRDSGRCLWHAEVDGKPVGELVRARSKGTEVLDGAYLDGVALDEEISFSNCRLRLARLSGASLRGTDFTGATLDWANLSDADLYDADLSGASLERADLAGATLDWADLTGAHLFDADLSGASLERADLAGASLYKADLTEATLDWANFSERSRNEVTFGVASFYETTLFGASLEGTNLSGVNLWRTELSEAEISRVNLSGATLAGLDLSGMSLSYSNLSKASLSSSNLSEASLEGTNLTAATLDRADLSGANLYNAELSGASLEGTDLSGASLDFATLSVCQLERAKLRDATLSNAKIQYAMVDHAHFLDSYVNSETELADEEADLKNVYECLADWIALGREDVIMRGEYNEPNYFEIAKGLFYRDDSQPTGPVAPEPLEPENLSPRRQLAAAYTRWKRRPITTFSWEEGEPVGIPHENPQVDLLQRANRVYLNYQRVLRENGMGDEAAKYFVRRKHVQRKLARAEGNNLDWLERAAERWILGYGEKPWHLLKLSTGVIVVCTLLYAFFGVVGPDGQGLVTDPLSLLLWSLLLSISTFLLAGDASGAEVNPVSTLGHAVTTFEAVAGAVLLALFFFVLGRVVER